MFKHTILCELKRLGGFLLVVFLLLHVGAADIMAQGEPEPTGPPAQASAPGGARVVRDFGPGLARAHKALRERYSGLLNRKDLGFDHEIENQMILDFQNYVRSIRSKSNWEIALHFLLPMAVFSLFLIGIGLMRPPFNRWARRRQSRVDLHHAEWVNRAARALIVIMGNAAPIAILIPLSYFPLQAVFPTGWGRLVSEFLWLLFGFELLQGTLIAIFGFRLVEVRDESATKLRRWGLWVMRVSMWWLALILVQEMLGYRDNSVRFIGFLFVLSLAFMGMRLFFLKTEVLEVLQMKDNVAGGSLLSIAERWYHPFVMVTLVLLILGAFGWIQAAQFILIRTYGAVVVIFASLRITYWMRTKISSAAESAQGAEQSVLFKSIGRMLRGAGILFFFVVTLHLVHLWVPLKILLDIPLVIVGRAPISVAGVIEAILLVSSAVLMGKIGRAVMSARIYPLLGVEVGVGYAINTLGNYAVIVVGAIIALSSLGVDFSALTVLMASLGVGIGLGLQNLTENLISGFILLFGRSVQKGDVITVGGVYGRVDEVGARSVIIKTPDNFDMLIPSKNIVSGDVINWSLTDPFIRLRIPVGVSYLAKPPHVRSVLLDAARTHRRVLKSPKPEVLLTSFGDSSVNYELLVYYDIGTITRDRLVGQLNFIIWEKLEAANIEIPFPQQDLHLRTAEGLPDLQPVVDALVELLEKRPRGSGNPDEEE